MNKSQPWQERRREYLEESGKLDRKVIVISEGSLLPSLPRWSKREMPLPPQTDRPLPQMTPPTSGPFSERDEAC